MTGVIKTTTGEVIDIDRVWSATPTYGRPTTQRVGISQADPTASVTVLTTPIPIGNGTVVDSCEDTFTGSNGGSNSTDNTTTFKEGAATTDDTSQNLITNTGSATKTWTLSTLDNNVTATQPISFWFYIADSTTLAYFLTSGTALEVKFGSDSSNYYSLTRTASQLSTGWNYITTGTSAVDSLTETGTVSGAVDTLIIEVTTNNATDSWDSGDVVIDLFRNYSLSDLEKLPESGYPNVDLTARETTTRYQYGPTVLSGHSPNAYTHETTSNDLYSIAVTAGAAKTDEDEFIVQTVHRARLS